jgi:hypothetical protein
MNNPYKDKADAKKEMVESKIMELKAKMKDASADARISIQRKIDELKASVKSFTK